MRDPIPSAALALALLVLVAAPAAAQTIRLDADRAAEMVIESSPLVDAAEARLHASLSAVEAADAARLPVVSAGATVGRQNAIPELAVPIFGPDEPLVTLFPSIEATYMADLQVLQPLYTGGATTAGREAARHDSEAAAFSRRLTRVELGFSARVAYWRAVAAGAGLEAAQAQERRAQRLLGDARALREAGMVVNADVLAAQARAEAARLGFIRAETDRATALAGLRSLIGAPVGATVELDDASRAALPPAPGTLEALTDVALEERADLKAADASIASLGARERMVDAARRPTVSLAGQWQLARPSSRYLPLEDRWNDSWSVALVAGWTLFDGDRTRAEAAVVRAQQTSAVAERAETARRVSLEVENARLGLAAALDAIGPADASMAASTAREEASRERYAAGLAPVWEMLDAQAELADAEVAVIRARAAAWIAAAALERAVGR